MFKVGDNVFHIKYEWCIIQEIAVTQVLVRYKCDTLIGDQICDGYEEKVLDLDLLSFTEYTLQGFSQKRPIELPEIGELCLVRDFEDCSWKARNFKKFTDYFVDDNGQSWDEYKRIKILD